MHLKSLELTGFKSFAKKTELEFSTPITAIVGPNGSGKSNIAEAFRFALGEQKVKSMRGRRTEDLIWNGSQTVARSNRASVTLTLDNADRFLDIDFDEVSLSRVIHRDASNEYLINGSQARLKDVGELVTGANIGSTGHHIISQGEADRILNVSAKDRKLILEDALGLKIYHYRIQESQRKLERTNENIKEVESLRRELAPHLRFLKKQVEKVEKAREMRVALERLYKDYFARESFYINTEKKRLEEGVRQPREELAVVDSELEEARVRIKEESVSSEILNAYSEAERVLEGVRQNKSTLERSLGRTEGEAEALQRLFERERRAESERAQLTVSTRALEDLEEKIVSAVDDARSRGAFDGIGESIRGFFRSFLEAVGAADANEGVVAEREKELLDKKAEVRRLTRELEQLQSDEKNAEQKIVELQSLKEKEKDSYKDAEKEVFRLQAKRSEIKARLDEISGKLSQLNLVEDEFKRDLAEAGALVGRVAVDFVPGEVKGEGGEVLDRAEVLGEERVKQVERKKEIERLKIRLEEAGGSGGDEITKEYEATRVRDEFLEKEITDLHSSEQKLSGLIGDLEKTLENRFREGVLVINKEFENFFSLMFGGGKASLDVVKQKIRTKRDTDLGGLSYGAEGDEEEDEGESGEEGVEIKINLPHKKIRGLEMLSGGERALTSIALLFAMSQVNPPPFIILDETDAALDEANSRKYGDMIEKLSQESQLILITHNRETMSRAGVLYGVTMGSDGVSKLLSVKFEEAVRVAK